MRILSVSHFFEAHGGGIEIVAGALARSLSDLGCDSRWAAADFDAPPVDGRIETVPLAAVDPLERLVGLPMPLPTFRSVQRLIRAIDEADAVVVHDALYASSIIAALAARRRGKPWVLIQHIGEIPFSNPILRFLMRTANAIVTRPMMAAATQVVFISETVRAQFSKSKLQPAARLIFNGVDASKYYPGTEADRRLVRSRWGVKPEARVALFVGRFVEKKGMAILREIAKAKPDHEFVLAGDGPIDPRKWGLSNVRVLGRLSSQEVAEAYRGADFLLLPSAGEGFPLVVQEAMVSGLSVICGADTAAADPKASGFLTGCRVDLADPTGTANRFISVIEKWNAADCRAAAAYAASAYSWRAFGTALVEVFTSSQRRVEAPLEPARTLNA